MNNNSYGLRSQTLKQCLGVSTKAEGGCEGGLKF